jgi:aspartate racemase
MAILGMVGGIAPAATIEYYRYFIEHYRARRPGGGDPKVVIDSIDLKHFLDLVAAPDRGPLVEHLLAELARLERAGADFALFTSNTPHMVFDELERRSPLPLLSIVEVAGAAAAARGYRRVGLIGTRFTMDGDFYPTVFASHGVAVVTPDGADHAYVNDRYLGELVQNVFRDETRAGMIAVMRRLREEKGVDAVILGGTELTPLFRGAEPADVPVLDTSRVHVEAAVERLLSLER